MTRIFIIGATGHIGGAFLEELLSMKNDNQISALVRGKDAGRKLTQRYKSPPYNANLAFVTGDLDSLDTLESESAKADIVVNAGPDITHDAGISAILRGLSCQPRKSYYIHTSGAASIWDRGDGTSKVWDDIADISTLTSLPETAHHRVTDKLVFDAHCNVNVAIISPGHVYGIGPSEFHPAPLTTGPLLTLAKVVGAGFIMNEGKNVQGYVHVRDLARMYLAMVEDALCGVANEGSREELWGPQAYYWAGSQNYSGKEISVALAPVLAKYNIIPAVEVKNSTYVTTEQAAKVLSAALGPNIPDLWVMGLVAGFSVDTKIRASRAKKLLGWTPREKSPLESWDDVIALYLKLHKI